MKHIWFHYGAKAGMVFRLSDGRRFRVHHINQKTGPVIVHWLDESGVYQGKETISLNTLILMYPWKDVP